MILRRFPHQIMLVGATYLVYLNAFGGAFQFDDFNVIVNNPWVHSWSAWWSELPHGIRPLLKASYTLNWTSGLGLFGFHLFNVTVHAANTVLVYTLTRRFLEGGAIVRAGRAPSAALLAALLFAVHPVQTEAITYVSGRSISLMTTLYLGSLLAYVHGRETGHWEWLYVASPALFAGSLATKEVAVTLPAAMLLWEVTCRQGRISWQAIARRQAAHWVLLLAGVIVLIAHPRYGSLLAFSLSVRTVHDNVLTQIHGVVYLLSRLVWVHRLNIDPDLPVITHWMPTVVAELIGILSILTLGLAGLRRRPWLAFGILWLFFHLLPTNSIVPRLDVANERSLYLAAWGVCLPFGVAWAMLQDRRPEWVTPVRVGTAVLILVLAGWTLARNHTYRNEVALWEDTVGKSPQKARGYNNLGYAYFLAGRDEEARASYLMALRLDPEFLLARNNLAALTSDDLK